MRFSTRSLQIDNEGDRRRIPSAASQTPVGLEPLRHHVAVQTGAPVVPDAVETIPGAGPQLLQLLEDPDEETRRSAAVCVAKLARGAGRMTEQRAAVLLRHDLGTECLQLLASDQPESIREVMARAVADLADSGRAARDTLLAENAMGLVTDAIVSSGSNSLPTLRNLARAVGCLLRHRPPPPFEAVATALPVCRDLMQHPDTTVQYAACWAVSYICAGPVDRIAACHDAGLISMMVEVLRSQRPRVVLPAIRVLGDYARVSDGTVQDIIKERVLELMVPLTQPHVNRRIQRECCWMLSNVAAGTHAHVWAVLDSGLMPFVVRCMSGPEPEIMQWAVTVLANIGRVGTPVQCRVAVERFNCIPGLCAALRTRDVKTCSAALEACTAFLARGDDSLRTADFTEKTDSTGGFGVNPYVALFEKHGIGEILPHLVESQDEGVNRRANALREYFDAGSARTVTAEVVASAVIAWPMPLTAEVPQRLEPSQDRGSAAFTAAFLPAAGATTTTGAFVHAPALDAFTHAPAPDAFTHAQVDPESQRQVVTEMAAAAAASPPPMPLVAGVTRPNLAVAAWKAELTAEQRRTVEAFTTTAVGALPQGLAYPELRDARDLDSLAPGAAQMLHHYREQYAPGAGEVDYARASVATGCAGKAARPMTPGYEGARAPVRVVVAARGAPHDTHKCSDVKQLPVHCPCAASAPIATPSFFNIVFHKRAHAGQVSVMRADASSPATSRQFETRARGAFDEGRIRAKVGDVEFVPRKPAFATMRTTPIGVPSFGRPSPLSRPEDSENVTSRFILFEHPLHDPRPREVQRTPDPATGTIAYVDPRPLESYPLMCQWHHALVAWRDQGANATLRRDGHLEFAMAREAASERKNLSQMRAYELVMRALRLDFVEGGRLDPSAMLDAMVAEEQWRVLQHESGGYRYPAMSSSDLAAAHVALYRKDVSAAAAFMNATADEYVHRAMNLRCCADAVSRVVDGVTLNLLPHQRETVAFIRHMERDGVRHFTAVALPGSAGEMLHVNTALGVAFVSRPVTAVRERALGRAGPRGGYIADELGKTLSIIAAIVLDLPEAAAGAPAIVDVDDVDFAASYQSLCPTRHPLLAETEFRAGLRKRLSVKATLIIVPVSLVKQWAEELKRCAGLAVLELHGPKRRTFTYDDLAAADVVLTTAETLGAILAEEHALHTYHFVAATSNVFTQVNAGLAAKKAAAAAKRESNKRGSAAADPDAAEDAATDVPDAPAEAPPAGGVAPCGNKEAQILMPQANGPIKMPPAFLTRVHFRRVVCDEFHRASTLPPKLQAIAARFRWMLSSTPLASRAVVEVLPAIGVLGGLTAHFVQDVNNRLFVADHALCSRYDATDLFDVTETFAAPIVANPPVAGLVPTPLFRLGCVLQRFMMRHTKEHCVPAADTARPAEDGVAASSALDDSTAHANSLLVLPPPIEAQVDVQLAPPELERYAAYQQRVREAVSVVARRGELRSKSVWVLGLLDQLRRAAIDPAYVSDLRLLAGDGAADVGENRRRGVVPVAVRVFQAAVLTSRADRDSGRVDDATRALAATAPAHVAAVDTSDALMEALEMMCGAPVILPECAVCRDDVSAPVVLRCGHFYCRACLLGVLSAAAAAAPVCPSCRDQTLTDLKSQLIFPWVEAEAERRRAAAAAEKAAAPADAADVAADDANYGPKVRAVMKIVRSVLAAGTDKRASANKIVIASSFPAALQDVQRALSREGIAHVPIDATSRGGRDLAAFQSDEGTAEPGADTPRVCLLKPSVGNAGLTLTAANHLIVLEPGSHGGDVLARLQRIGQRRPVTVHRLVTAATVEVEIAALSRDGAFTLRATAITGGGGQREDRRDAVRAFQQRLYRILGVDLVANPDAEAMMGFEAGFEAYAEALGVLGANRMDAVDDDDPT
jgi:hypothetical protein